MPLLIWSEQSLVLLKFLSADCFIGLEGRFADFVYCLIFESLWRRLNSCELDSSRDPSLRDLQELAVHVFSRSNKTPEHSQNTVSDSDGNKNLQSKDFLSNPNISPLARFLISR